jgi:hypothetical protein
MVIWMVVAMAFFRNEPITDVVRRLNLSADGEAGMNLLARKASPRPASGCGPRLNGSFARLRRHGEPNATEMIVLGNTVSPGTIPKRLEHLRGNLDAVFITKRP